MDSMPQKSLFLEKVRQLLRVQHYAFRTEQVYIAWIRRFILFHNKRHPSKMGEQEVDAFLTHLAVNRHVSPATQGQALNALVFLYSKVLDRPLQKMDGFVRSKKQPKIPVVLTTVEVVKNVIIYARDTLVNCLPFVRFGFALDGVHEIASTGY